jgi:hypothetical protein
VSAWWLAQGKSWGLGFTTISILACLVGLALVFNERAIELSFGKFGKLKAAAQQAQTDAKEISEIRKRVEAQAATMDLVAKESADAKVLLGDLAHQNKLAEEKIETIKELAAPPKLSLRNVETKDENGNYRAVLTFSSSKNEPLGILTFVSTIQGDTETKIVDFWPSLDSGAFQSGPDSKKISPDGKSARLIYSLMGAGSPSVILSTSGPATVEVRGSHELQPFTIEIQ